MASGLERWTPDQEVVVRALAGDIMLRFWRRPFSTQVYNWVPANSLLGRGDNPAMD